MRTSLRWAALHGVPAIAFRRWAAQGDLQATLIADPRIQDDPGPAFDRIRAAGRLPKTRIGYITVDYEIANLVLRSDEFRVTSVAESVPPGLAWLERATRGDALHPLQAPSLLAVEPPDHTRYRVLVASVFTARAVAGLRDRVQTIADALLDEIAATAGPVDIVDRYCARLPVAVISDILGVPAADRSRVLEYGELAAPSLDFGLSRRDYASVERGLRRFDRWLSAHLAELRRRPGTDLMSQLVRASADGHALDDQELRATAGLVLVAGFETTVNLLGNGVRLLLDHPDQLAVLQDRPDQWANAVDEVLRLESPVRATARVARRSVELADQHVGAGRVVSLVLAGANRDPAIFADPQTFDVLRPNANRHLAFSGGRHYCLGAALARVEGEVGLRSLFTRFPELRAAGPGVRRPTRVLRGWAQLPVVTPSPQAA